MCFKECRLRIEVRDVQPVPLRAVACICQRVNGLGQFVRTAGGKHHMGPLLCQSCGAGQSNAPTSSGDKRSPTIKSERRSFRKCNDRPFAYLCKISNQLDPGCRGASRGSGSPEKLESRDSAARAWDRVCRRAETERLWGAHTTKCAALAPRAT